MTTTTVLVCAGDELARRALGRTATEHGLTLVDEAANAVQALQILSCVSADVVVIANELQGLSGTDVTPELVAAGYRVIVICADPWGLEGARQAGAFAAVPRGDLAQFEAALISASIESADGERRRSTDRRSGSDRREVQDWSKVTSERRDAERRQATRRGTASDARRDVTAAG